MLSRILKNLVVLSLIFLPKIKAENNDLVLNDKVSNIIITAPTFDFTYLCQSQTINTIHNLEFQVFSPSGIQAGNQFILEISNDDFVTPIVLTSNTTQVGTTNVFNMTFTLNSAVAGTGYKLRIRSTAPMATSAKSIAFDAYFMSHNQEIKLNNAVGVDNVSYCTGSSYTLSIFDSGTNSSPLFYPNLTYTWFKKVGAVFQPIATGTSLSVSSPGEYYVQTDYGQCSGSSFSKSRIVTVTEAGNNSVIITTNPVTNTICEGNGVLLSLNVTNNPAYTIAWYLNGELINGETSNTHNALVAGSYYASVDNGSCIAESQPYVLNAISFNASLDLNSPYELPIGGSVVASVTTDANTPAYQWFLNDNILTGETNSTLTITQTGEYKVKVTQTVGCIIVKELILQVIGPDVDQIPNLISPNDDGFNDKFKVPFELISSNNLSLEIYNSAGKQIYVTDNYQNNWPEDTNEIFQSKAFFYFKLTKENQLIKEGILTIIK